MSDSGMGLAPGEVAQLARRRVRRARRAGGVGRMVRGALYWSGGALWLMVLLDAWRG